MLWDKIFFNQKHEKNSLVMLSIESKIIKNFQIFHLVHIFAARCQDFFANF